NARTCRRNLGLAYQLAGRWSDALRTFQELATVLADSDGSAGWVALANDMQIALCHEALADWPAAEAVLSEVLDRAAQAASQADDAWECTLSSMLSRCLVRRGDLDSAARWLA